jgi:MFS family permease
MAAFMAAIFFSKQGQAHGAFASWRGCYKSRKAAADSKLAAARQGGAGRVSEKKAESGPQPPIASRTLHASYAAGLLSMGQAELLTMLVPLWALMQGAQPAEIGLLIGAKSALTFFLAIHGGALMDRLGTRRVMLFFAAATGVLAAIYPLLPWLAAMVALQMLIGFAGNMNWIGAQTIIAQVTNGDPSFIGRFSFFARIGNVVAPVLMGLLWDFAGPTVSFLGVTAWCCVMFLAVSQINLPPSKTTITGRVRIRDVLPRLSDYTGALGLITLPIVAFTLSISFMRHATNAAENSFVIVYLRDLGFAGTMIGLMFSFAEILNGCASLVSGRVARLMPIPWIMVSLTMASAALLTATPFLGGNYFVLAAAHALRRGAEGIVQPLMFSLQARAVPRNQQGAIVGLRVTNNRLASIVTPIIMGLIVQAFGLENGFLAIGALLLTGGLVLAWATMRSPELRNHVSGPR